MTKRMEINKETAMRLWNKQIGKVSKTVDFAGREIAKAAYDDRKSKFGWNIDHIYPESKGGKTADYNLICCNIATNDEKGDKFPCFKANGINFEIQKHQNHYEISKLSNNQKVENKQDKVDLDIYKAKEGIQYFDQFIASETMNYTYVRVEVDTYCDNQADYAQVVNRFYSFLKKIFETNVIFGNDIGHDDDEFTAIHYFTILFLNTDKVKDDLRIFEKCKLLNAYIRFYFNEFYDVRIFLETETVRRFEADLGDFDYNIEDSYYAECCDDLEDIDYTFAIGEFMHNTLDLPSRIKDDMECYEDGDRFSGYRSCYVCDDIYAEHIADELYDLKKQ